jgi:hypothetical protein
MLTRFHNLNLRFIGEEGEGGGGDNGLEAPAEPTQQQEPTGGNPAWDSVRSELDEFSFHKIEPHLKEWDRSASERIASVNQQLAPFKSFIDAGTTPEDIAAGLQLAQMANTNPEQLYEAIGSFLEREGRMPNKAEVKAEVKANEGEEQQPEAQPAVDPRYDELAAQNQQMMQFLQAQEYQKAVDQADRELQTEQTGLQTKHPELSAADMQDIIRQAAFVAQTTGTVPSLESVHDGWFTELRTRFLSTPRPGDAAPRLVPTSGGVPSAIPQKSLGALSSAEVQDLIASSIEQNR